MPRRVIDLSVVLATGTVCLVTAYWLINRDFIFIYAVCFVYTAAAAWWVSASWLKNTFTSLSALLFSLTIAELALAFVEPEELRSAHNVARFVKGYSQPLRENGGELGYRPYPARAVQAWKTFGREKLYDVVYTINEDGYRQTPGFAGGEEGTPPIVFFGGSFAFGEGVDDNETLPYFVAAETNWSRPVLNLAFSGYGPHQMLRSLELGMLRELGYPSVGIAIYVAVPDHARRAAGGAWWDPVGPRYELDGMGTVQYQGRFVAVPERFLKAYYRYLQVIKLARRSRVVDWTANLLLPPEDDDPTAKVQLMVEIIGQSAAILEQNYQAKLVVLFWDDEAEDSTLILEGLAEKEIPTIPVSDFIAPPEQDVYRIPNDRHPTAAANQLIAEGLVQRLGSLEY